MLQYYNYHSDYFVYELMLPIKASVCEVTPKSLNSTASLIANSTAIECSFSDIERNFTKRFRRKEFVHYYTSEGLDEMQFVEAKSNTEDLISEYRQHHDVSPEDS